MEGVSGVGRGEMVPHDSGEYDFCVKRLMADVNAAVDGAFLGGADHVTVLDSHGGGGNFDLSLLDKRAEHDEKLNKKWWGVLDDSYYGSFFIGAHAMAGTLNGFLDHTMDSQRILNFYVNGRKFGELGVWAMVCAQFNVPMIMVSGDQAAVHEAAQFFSGVETAEVKAGLSRMRARLLPDDEAEERIRQAAKRAVEKDARPAVLRPLLPMELKTEFMRGDYCDNTASNPAIERIDVRTARKISNTYQDYWL
jgi:D-amino peptidase